MVAAPPDAAALLVAGHAVRHATAADHQDCRSRRRAEEAGPYPPPIEQSRPADLRSLSRPPAAPGHLIHGAGAPPNPSLQPLAHYPSTRTSTTPPPREWTRSPSISIYNHHGSIIKHDQAMYFPGA